MIDECRRVKEKGRASEECVASKWEREKVKEIELYTVAIINLKRERERERREDANQEVQ